MTTVTVTDRSALAAALRQLKLSGMLDTLDARLAQARAGELGHLDFLQVLCQDEISRRESTSLARRIRRARFETPATLEGFDFGAAPKLPAAQRGGQGAAVGDGDGGHDGASWLAGVKMCTGWPAKRPRAWIQPRVVPGPGSGGAGWHPVRAASRATVRVRAGVSSACSGTWMTISPGPGQTARPAMPACSMRSAVARISRTWAASGVVALVVAGVTASPRPGSAGGPRRW